MTYDFYVDGAATMKKVDNEYIREAGGFGLVGFEKQGNKLIQIVQKYGGTKITTNNEQELTAIYQALLFFKEKKETNSILNIYSDSSYCINIYTRWAKNWERNGWTRGKKHEPIENLTLIQKTWKLLQEINESFNSVNFIKVKGHSGNVYNEAADTLAVTGKREAYQLSVGFNSFIFNVDKENFLFK